MSSGTDNMLRHVQNVHRPPGWRGRPAGQFLALRVIPQVLESKHKQSPRRHTGQQIMLIERQSPLVRGIFTIGRTKPMRENLDGLFNRLAKAPSRQGNASRTGLTGDRDRNTFVKGASQQRRLGQPGPTGRDGSSERT